MSGDDYGKTGIEYYLRTHGVPFEWYGGAFGFKKGDLILTNNKKELEKILTSKKLLFTKFFSDADQYHLYMLNEN